MQQRPAWAVTVAATLIRPLLQQFQQTPMPFARNSRLMISDGSIIELDSVDVSNGTLPVGGSKIVILSRFAWYPSR